MGRLLLVCIVYIRITVDIVLKWMEHTELSTSYKPYKYAKCNKSGKRVFRVSFSSFPFFLDWFDLNSELFTNAYANNTPRFYLHRMPFYFANTQYWVVKCSILHCISFNTALELSFYDVTCICMQSFANILDLRIANRTT